MRRLLMLFVLCGFFMPCFSKQDTTYNKRNYTAREVQTAPVIDGWLNDEAWETVPWEDGFQMFEPYDNRPASQETRFKVVFDKENIYVGIRAFDTAPDSIVQRLTRRDEIDGDMVAFQLDSYHDLQTAFTFLVSAAGSKADFYMSDDGESEDETWNAIWWTKTRVDDRGWTMEAKIPFSQLRFDRSSGGVWGFQVAREVYRYSETSLWQPMSKESPGWVHLLGELKGLQNIDPKKQAEIIPYVVAGSEWFEAEADNPFREDGKNRHLNGGVDAKIGLTNFFTLDLTINPDFGQVEADPSQVNLTAFETFFEEQRPFFIEGNNIFDYDLAVHSRNNLFYSRRVGRRPQHYPDTEDEEYADVPTFTNILGAAKVSGKTKDGLSVGIMESVTASQTAIIDNGYGQRNETVEPLTNYFTGRLSKEFNKGYTRIGGIFTSTHRFSDEDHLDFLHSSAYSGGVDFQQFFADRSYVLSATAYGSNVNGSEEALIRTQRSSVHLFQRPDADHLQLDSTRTSLDGYGGSLSFGKQSGRFNFMSFLNFSSPGLELNDLGFLSSTDEIIQIFWMGYAFNEPFSIFRSARINFNQWNAWDFGGVRQVSGFNINAHARFNNLWMTGFFWNMDSEQISSSTLRGGPSIVMPGEMNANFFLGTNSRNKLSFELSGFLNKGGEESQSRYGVDFEINYKPISNLSIALYPEYGMRESQLQYVDQQEAGGTERYVFGSINQKTLSMSLRLDFILTPEMTIQFWGQPFIASGDYSKFKYITDSHAIQFQDRFHTYGKEEIEYVAADEYFNVTETGSGFNYQFDNPDFNVKEFLSNLVFRWEYRPGSFLYLVWSQTRSGYDPWGYFHFGEDFGDMWDIHPTNVVLLKLSYRIGR
jgi:Domain of unknown function (DUF5916)/Carbohydrate family 9 binding domain-like